MSVVGYDTSLYKRIIYFSKLKFIIVHSFEDGLVSSEII